MVSSRFRKLVLTAHIVWGVGWIGALSAFLVLAVAGIAAKDVGTVRAAYVSMDLITKFAIIPLAVATLVNGVALALITRWGLVRHYWVAFKLLLVLAAIFTLINEAGRIAYLAGVAAQTGPLPEEVRGLRLSVVVHSIAGLAVLLWATTLGIYKPRGTTLIGSQGQPSEGSIHNQSAAPQR